MTTKTAINLSPIKRCHGSTHIKKRRLLALISNNRKQQTNLSLSMYALPTFTYETQISLPDLVQDILIEQHQQRRETIIHLANLLRKVGDQIDEQLQINNTSSATSIDHRFSQRTIQFVHCLSSVLRFFL